MFLTSLILLILSSYLNDYQIFLFCSAERNQSTFILPLLSLSIREIVSFLADKLTLRKQSSELNEVVQAALLIGCRKLTNIRDFRILLI